MTNLSLDDFILEDLIGKGTFSHVYKAKHKVNGKYYAIKQIDLNKLTNQNMIDRELYITSNIKHPFITETYKSIKSSKKIILIMKYNENGTLLDYANKKGKLDEYEAKKIFIQLIDFLEFLHDQSIVHRDLKCENIMLDSNFDIKIVDFGFSRKIEGNEKCMLTLCGSLQYAAPEIIVRAPYNNSVDLWSAGVILYAITHGTLPFSSTNQVSLMHQILSSHPEINPELSTELRGMIYGLLEKDPTQRITIEQIKKHPWVAKEYDDILKKSPSYENVPIKIMKKPRIQTSDSVNLGNKSGTQPLSKFIHSSFSTSLGRKHPALNFNVAVAIRNRNILYFEKRRNTFSPVKNTVRQSK